LWAIKSKKISTIITKEPKIVRKSPAMVRLFKRIDAIKRGRKTTPVLIVGPSGSGKTAIAETFTTPENYYSLNAGALSAMRSEDMLNVLIDNIRKANNKADIRGILEGTLIINNFENASEELQDILLGCFEKAKAIIDREGNSISIQCRIVITTTQTTHLEKSLLNRLQGTTLEIPDRAEDIVLLAEYFNWELSMEYNIPWAPLDEFVGQILQDTEVVQKWEYDIGGIQSIMREIIINRLQILSGDLPDDFYEHRNLYEHWKRNLITMADFLSLKEDNPVSTKIETIMESRRLAKDNWIKNLITMADFLSLIRKYNMNSNKPYFKELQDAADLANVPKADSFGPGDEGAPDINTRFSYFTALQSAL